MTTAQLETHRRDARLTPEPARQPAATRAARRRTRELRWLLSALALTLLFASRTLQLPGRGQIAVADDMRQYITFLSRFRDPELFRDDLIADYYQAVTPLGYSALYWVLTRVWDPVVASRFLPLPLGLAAALFTFLLTRQFHPSPRAGFLAAVLLSWYVWQYEDIASATPRAFMLPLLTAELWALAAGRVWSAVGITVLAALFYPFAALLGVALLGVRLVRLRSWRLTVTRERTAWAAALVAGTLVAAVLLADQQRAAPFGPTASKDLARDMPEFSPLGRHDIFFPDAYTYYVMSRETGLDLKIDDLQLPEVPILFEYAALAGLLPLALFCVRKRRVRPLSGRTILLLQLLLVSSGLFVLAHLTLFHLYLPSRYIRASLPLVLAVCAALGLSLLFGVASRLLVRSRRGRLASLLVLGFAAGVALYPALYRGQIRYDPHPRITAYLQRQPKDILVAGAPATADNVPAFASRRVVASREHALVWHFGYYNRMRPRINDLIEAYYAESPGQIAEYAAQYGVDVFLVHRSAFSPARFRLAWSARWEPFHAEIRQRLGRSSQFALLELAETCATVDDGEVLVVPSACWRGGS